MAIGHHTDQPLVGMDSPSLLQGHLPAPILGLSHIHGPSVDLALLRTQHSMPRDGPSKVAALHLLHKDGPLVGSFLLLTLHGHFGMAI